MLPIPAPWRRPLRISAYGLAGFLIVFGLVGYLWLPGFAKTKAEEVLTKALHRPVTIQRIAVSPYTLSATVEGFQAGDVLSVKSLLVNVSSTSLVRGIPVISQVRIEEPKVHLVRESATRLNVSDLIDEWLAKPASPTPEFSVSNIQVEGGEVVWEDKVVRETQKLSSISLGVPFVANVLSKVEVFVEPRFRAEINGAPFNLGGKLRPFGAGHDAAVNLDLEGLDLTPAMGYLHLPLKLRSAKLSTKLQVLFAKPKDQTPSLTVVGDVAVNDLQSSLLEERARIGAGSLALRGIKLDLFGQKVSVEQVSLSKPNVALRRTGPGSLDFASLNWGGNDKAKTKTETKSIPWHWSVGQTVVEEGAFRFEDSTVANALPLQVSGLKVKVGALSSDKAEAAPVNVQASVNQRGSVSVDGRASVKGDAEFQVDLKHVDLVALQGWAADKLNVQLTKGDVSFLGKSRWQAGAGEVSGDLLLSDFSVLDSINADDLLRWKSFSLTKLNVTTQPLAIDLGDVALKDFFAKVLVTPKGQLNLRDIVKHDAEGAAPAKGEAKSDGKAVAKVEAAPTKSAPLPLKIGRISLDGGTVNFTDRFIKPNYSTRITGLSGHIGALAAGTLSPVDLRGKVERTAPLEISGKVDPLSSPIGLDIKASARGIDLPPFSAYSGRYVGYAIEKGKFSADVSYKVTKGELVAENHVFLDQLTFGEKVESKDAINLPVNLAVALLKNSRGEIDVNLPISGSLNDPKFSVGGIILKVIFNLLAKAVTSPFALLGSVFGSGEDLSQVAFPPGLSRITPEMEDRLKTLAKAMADRPALKLEINGIANPAVDREGLRQAVLDRKLRALKLSDQAKQGKSGGRLADVQLSAAERQIYLEKLYKSEDFKDKPRNVLGLAKSLPSAEMEALLLAHQAAADTDLLTLAEDRAQRVQAWLSEQGGVATERMFLHSPRVEANKADGKDAAGGRVVFSLR
ncbi:MAG TPA: DUF748 domain-containing protein [Rhodocyclaceae bacterium]|nr:DUF748 domain-containing protein [Rhodocyclaceae bacterium]